MADDLHSRVTMEYARALRMKNQSPWGNSDDAFEAAGTLQAT